MSYYGQYDFILNELFPKKKKEFKKYKQFLEYSQEYHKLYMFQDICFISDFPKAIRRNEENRLHSYDKPALEYRDGYSLYYSNGVQVTKEFTETKPENFTKDMILGESNADVAREMIRKIGIQQAMNILDAKIVDTFSTKTGGKYELLTIDYNKRGERPFLKMQCSSSKEVFILGVKPDIKTAKDALEFLNNGYKLDNTEIVWES